MGGKLFSTKRLPKDEYESLRNEVSWILNKHNLKHKVPESFHNKEDFGDLDIILEFPIISNDKLVKMFGIDVEDININSTVVSFKYKDFQVDLCHFPLEDFESAYNYYSHSDCSNIIGQLSRYATGYRFTHRGLTYPVKVKPEDMLGEIVVSKDMKMILEFLDLDFNQWIKGFDDAEQMFEWITKSKYFNPNCFKFENLNHENRTRNKKRKVYSEFVEYLNKYNDSNLYFYVPSENKQEHLFNGLLFFYETNGFWIKEAEQMISKRTMIQEGNKKFNGLLIKEWTGVENALIGKIKREFMDYLSVFHEGTPIENILYSYNKEYIEMMFKRWYLENKKYL